MKRMIVCMGLLLCVGCTRGSLFPSPLSAYSDEELQRLLVERYYECGRAAASGNEARLNRAVDAFMDVYEEALSRPSLGGSATGAEVQAMRQYLDLVRSYANAAYSENNEGGYNYPVGEVSNDPSLIGTWQLKSQNGQNPGPGIYLQWTFTDATVTITCDLDCTEVLTYSAANGVLRTLSIVSREGSQCGPADESGEIGYYSIDGNTLTVTTTDPMVTPATIVSVFTKVR